MTNEHGTASVTATPGTLLELGGALVQLLPRDLPPERAKFWLDNRAALQAALRSALFPNEKRVEDPSAIVTYPVTVLYGLSLEEMVKRGRYDWVNEHITQTNFPRPKRRKQKGAVIELIKFDKAMESDDVIAELDKMGLRPATIEELLAFGEMYPDVQREFPVVALGSVASIGGHRRVPYLSRYGSGRDLDLLLWWGSRWYALSRFAAVRK